MKSKGLILILLSIVLFNYKIINDKNDIKYHNEIIEKINNK